MPEWLSVYIFGAACGIITVNVYNFATRRLRPRHKTLVECGSVAVCAVVGSLLWSILKALSTLYVP